MKDFYVYVFTLNSVPVYIGKGSNSRYKNHATDTNSPINTIYHKCEVSFPAVHLTNLEALAVEKVLIAQHKETILNNRVIHRGFTKIQEVQMPPSSAGNIKHKKAQALLMVIESIKKDNKAWSKSQVLYELKINYSNLHSGIVPTGALLHWKEVLTELENNNIFQVQLRAHNVSGAMFTYINGGI